MTYLPSNTIDIKKTLNEFILWEKNIVDYAGKGINFDDINSLRNPISRRKYEKTLMDIKTYRLSLVLMTTSKPYTLGKLASQLGAYTPAQHSTYKVNLRRTLERMQTYQLVSYEKENCYQIIANKKLIEFFKNKSTL